MSIFNSNLITVNDTINKIEEMVFKYQPDNNNISVKNNIYKNFNWEIILDIFNINPIIPSNEIKKIFNNEQINKKIIDFLYEIIPTNIDNLYTDLPKYFGYIISNGSNNMEYEKTFYNNFKNLNISEDIKNIVYDKFIDYLKTNRYNDSLITCQCCQVTTGFIDFKWKYTDSCKSHILCNECYNRLTIFNYVPGDKINLSNHVCPICRIYIAPIRKDNDFDEIPFKQVIDNLLNHSDNNKPVYYTCIKNNCGAILCGGYESCLEYLDSDNIDKSKLLCSAHKLSVNTLKPCANPSCRLVTDKITGCDHIVCPGCNYHWCWHCGYYQLPFLGINRTVEYDHAPYCGPVNNENHENHENHENNGNNIPNVLYINHIM